MADLVNLLQKDVYDGTWAVQVPDVEVDRALRGHVSELRNIDPSTLRADHKGSSLLQVCSSSEDLEHVPHVNGR